MAPDGSFAVVPVTEYDVDENKGRTRLYRVERDGATYVLEGTLQLASSKVRIGVQLVEAASGRRVLQLLAVHRRFVRVRSQRYAEPCQVGRQEPLCPSATAVQEPDAVEGEQSFL